MCDLVLVRIKYFWEYKRNDIYFELMNILLNE